MRFFDDAAVLRRRRPAQVPDASPAGSFPKSAEATTACEMRTFCSTPVYTGCRVSEALGLTVDRADREAGGNRFRDPQATQTRLLQARSRPARLSGYPSTWFTTSGPPRIARTEAKGFRYGSGPARQLGGASACHRGGRHLRRPCHPERIAPPFWRKGRDQRGSTQCRAKVAGTRAAHNDVDLRFCDRARGRAAARRNDVALGS